VYGFSAGGPEDIELKGPVANAGYLKQTAIGDDLHLFNGKHEIADIHLAGHYDPGQFTVAYDKSGGGVSYVMFNAADTSHQIVAAHQPLVHF
jgi:hypothetical protein